MKIVNILTTTAALACAFMSCKKEVADIQPPATEMAISVEDSSDLISSNSMIKGQTAIKAYFNSNIGGYLLAKPYNYSQTTKNYPLLISLHGLGECGDGRSNIYRVTNNSVPRLLQKGLFPKVIESNGKKFSFIVIAPQFKHFPTAADLNTVVNHAIKKYRVNTSRIYFTGLSMGGGAIMNFACAYPTKAAAIVPMAECSAPYKIGARAIAVGKLPVWAFHNRYDDKVSSQNTIGYINLINNYQTMVPVKKTIFNVRGHNCWLKATDPSFKQNDMNIYQWMLQFHR